MGYFIIISFSVFLGSPPQLLPIAFKNNKDCVSYLTKKVIEEFDHMEIIENNNIKYLANITNDKFIVCKKLEYPFPKPDLVDF